MEVIEKSHNPAIRLGPYRATRLWNDVIRIFRTGMPLGRHRRYMRTCENCFVSTDAVDWLHDHLQHNSNFGPSVTRAQTIQLLQKFHKARVFEDVRGTKHNRGEISDNGRLFRFTHNSPIKTKRTPLSTRTNMQTVNPNVHPMKMDHEKMKPVTCIPSTGLPECRLVARTMKRAEIEAIWKTVTLNNLKTVLTVTDLSDLIDDSLVNGAHITHNCVHLNKNGVVTNINHKDHLPHWALSAMRCLAHWPNKVEEHLPVYPGFERDVFQVVRDYFDSLPEPLLTYEMYEVITNVYVQAENRRLNHSSPNTCISDLTHLPSLASFTSVENLLMNLTFNNAGLESPEIAGNHLTRCSGELKSTNSLYLTQPFAESSNIYGIKSFGGSTPTLPITKYETAFGPENRTVTRIYYTSGDSSSCLDHGYSSPNLSEGVLETNLDLLTVSNPGYGSDRTCSYRYGSNGHNISRKQSNQSPQEDYITSNRRDTTDYTTFPRTGKHHPTMKRSYRDTYGVAVMVISPSQSDGNLSDKKNYGYAYENPTFTLSDEQCEVKPHKTLAPVPPPPAYRPPPSYSSHKTKRRHQSSSVHPLHSSQCGAGISLNTTTTHQSRSCSIAEGLAHIGATDSYIDINWNSDRASWVTSDKRTGLSAVKSVSLSDFRKTPLMCRSESKTASSEEWSENCPALSASELYRTVSSPALSRTRSHERVCEAIQLCLLLLPPANRRKLHLLLRLMNKMCQNQHLQLDDVQPMRTLVLETFYRAILSSPEPCDMDDLLVMQIISFLMDNYAEVMAVPTNLQTSVEERISQLRRTQVQVSSQEYEAQKTSISQRALQELLESIISNSNMALKEKRKRLKEFQKAYPDLYALRFPTSQSEAAVLPIKQPKIKQPLLIRPLHKLRNIRF